MFDLLRSRVAVGPVSVGRRSFAAGSTIGLTLALCVSIANAAGIAPANDLCANAIVVTCGTTVTGNTTEATTDGAPTCIVTDTAPGVWYKIAGTGESITLHTTSASTNYDTKISVYSGSCAALSCVVGDDDGGPNGTSRLSWASTAGTTYLVLVHGWLTGAGNFELSILCSAGRPGTLYASTGFDDGGRLLTINPANGAGALVGATGLNRVPDIAINSKGELFCIGTNITFFDGLYRIHGATGAATLIGGDFSDVEALAFDENDVLYGFGDAGSGYALITIDPATGLSTDVGAARDYTGMAFDPTDGRLYASIGDDIFLISKTTGAATFLGSTGLGSSSPALGFVGGQLYGTKGGGSFPNNLIAINKATGAGTVVGPIGFSSVSGLAVNSPCDCPALPADDKAAFKVGTPGFVAPDMFDVPLRVNTVEAVTFTQMTLEYQSSCLTYIADSAAPGGDVTNPGSIFVDVVDIGGGNRRLLLNMSGNYSGCDQHVLTLRFQRTGTGSCALSWDETLAGPNSNCHLNYDNSTGGDGKILPDALAFCDGVICDPTVTIAGTVKYYSNNTPIIAARPDMTSVAVRVEDCGDQNPTTTATSPNGDYSLLFGVGPQSAEICSSRPMAACGSLEDGVISGDDVIALQNDISPPPSTTDPKLRIAGDVNRDGIVDATDVLAIKRWIGRKVCDGTDACGQMTNNNCAANWTFIYLTGVGPDGFEKDVASLGSACIDKTVPVQGILVGDFDGSWPNIFLPKTSSVVDLALEARPAENGEVAVAMRAGLDAGESLRHIIYSLAFDETAFEYLGMQPGSAAPDWGSFDNPDIQGEAHGIAHIPPQTEGLTESGEVVVFRFRPRHSDARSTVTFTRLKANDLDVQVPGIEITGSGDATTVTAPLPTRYSVASHPNPFNPRTRVTYTIPTGVDRVPVELHIFDIAGRLVRTLETTERGPGQYVVDWDGKNDAGASTGTGIYMLRIQAGEWSEVEKLTLVK